MVFSELNQQPCLPIMIILVKHEKLWNEISSWIIFQLSITLTHNGDKLMCAHLECYETAQDEGISIHMRKMEQEKAAVQQLKYMLEYMVCSDMRTIGCVLINVEKWHRLFKVGDIKRSHWLWYYLHNG